jgi:hypothetical protein
MKGETKDLAQADEARQMEIKKLASSEYQNQYDGVMESLKINARSFDQVNFIERQRGLSSKNTFESLLKAVRSGDKEEMDKLVADYDASEQDKNLQLGMNGDSVRAVMKNVGDFLQQFGLEKFVALRPGMTYSEIQRAIDIGFEAKMWELTSKIE